MTEAELRDLIRLILEAIAEITRAKRGLMVFTGALIGFDDALESLRQAQGHLALSYVQTEAARCVLDQDKIAGLGMEPAGPHLVDGHDLLILPTLTANTAAKAAYSMADSLAPNLIMEFLLAGKPVVASTTAACPDSAAKRAYFPNIAPGQAAVMRDNLRRLVALGVHLCDADGLCPAIRKAAGLPLTRADVAGQTAAEPVGAPSSPSSGVDQSLPTSVETMSTPRNLTPTGSTSVPPAGVTMHCPERVVGATHVQSLPAGATLAVRPGAIVTPLAYDMATQRSITIERG